MAARRGLHFPLVIVCLVLIRGYFFLPTTSGVAGTNAMTPLRPRGVPTDKPQTMSDDYYDEETDPPISPSMKAFGDSFERCEYDACREGQTPCADLALSTGCLCPGFTLHNEAPQAPTMRSVSWNGSEVVIRWCAPNSYITGFIVTVAGQERKEFAKGQRSGGVGNIDHISEVCVAAVNDAGTSGGSCMMYQPRDNNLPLKAGLIGGALGLLLLLLLAVLLWRHKRQRKQQAGISMQDTAGTQ